MKKEQKTIECVDCNKVVKINKYIGDFRAYRCDECRKKK